MALDHTDRAAKGTVKEARGLEIIWKIWHRSLTSRTICLLISGREPTKAICITSDCTWPSKSWRSSWSWTQITSLSWDMGRTREDQWASETLGISQLQLSREVPRYSTSRSRPKTSAATLSVDWTKTVATLELQAFVGARLITNRGPIAAQIKPQSIKVTLYSSETKQRAIRCITGTILISKTGQEDTTILSKSKRCKQLKMQSPTNMPLLWWLETCKINTIGTFWQTRMLLTPPVILPESIPWMVCLSHTETLVWPT